MNENSDLNNTTDSAVTPEGMEVIEATLLNNVAGAAPSPSPVRCINRCSVAQ